VSAIVIIQNPVSQLLDRWTSLPAGFSFGRVIVRSLQVLACMGLALSIPKGDFLCMVNLIGGSTTTCLTFIFPPLFLIALGYKGEKLAKLDTSEYIVYVIIVIFGIFAGISSTRSAIRNCPF
jgi:solute carrier family 32 (vesicular inhibitory amino acid transporter)